MRERTIIAWGLIDGKSIGAQGINRRPFQLEAQSSIEDTVVIVRKRGEFHGITYTGAITGDAYPNAISRYAHGLLVHGGSTENAHFRGPIGLHRAHRIR